MAECDTSLVPCGVRKFRQDARLGGRVSLMVLMIILSRFDVWQFPYRAVCDNDIHETKGIYETKKITSGP